MDMTESTGCLSEGDSPTLIRRERNFHWSGHREIMVTKWAHLQAAGHLAVFFLLHSSSPRVGEVPVLVTIQYTRRHRGGMTEHRSTTPRNICECVQRYCLLTHIIPVKGDTVCQLGGQNSSLALPDSMAKSSLQGVENCPSFLMGQTSFSQDICWPPNKLHAPPPTSAEKFSPSHPSYPVSAPKPFC